MNAADAEQAVLGAVMLWPEAFWRIADRLTEQDFERAEHRAIWRAVRYLADAGRPHDAVTIGEWAESRGAERKIGGSAYLIELTSTTPSAANIEAYAEIVRDKATLRRLVGVGAQIGALASQPEGRSGSEVYSEAQRLLLAAQPRMGGAVETMTGALSAMVDALQAQCDGQVRGASFGIESLDAMTGLMQPGDLVILAGRPSMGKTAAALQSVLANAHPLVFSLEMAPWKLARRLTAAVGRFPLSWLTKPLEAPDEAMGRIIEATRELKARDILIEGRRLGAQEICAVARQKHAESPRDIIVIDHLGYVPRECKRRDDLELGEVTKRIRDLGKELHVPVMLLCQLNRSVEHRTDKRPIMADLRESGEIEQDADIVVMPYRDEYYHPDGPLLGYAEFLVRKNRDGELGTAWARSLLGQMRFESCDPPEVNHGSGQQVVGIGRASGIASRRRTGAQSPRVSGAGVAL